MDRKNIKEDRVEREEVLSCSKWLLQLLLHFQLSVLLSQLIVQLNLNSLFLINLSPLVFLLTTSLSHNACLCYPFPNPLNLLLHLLSLSLSLSLKCRSLNPLKLFSLLLRGRRVFLQL